MAKVKTETGVGTDDAFRELGINPDEAVGLRYEIWAPWEHDHHPRGIRGIYGGYKLAQKEIKSDQVNEFELFYIDSHATNKQWLIASSFQLDELMRVKPGTEVAIVYSHSEKNSKGTVNHLKWVFVNKQDRETCVARLPLPAINQRQHELEATSRGFGEDNPDA